MTCLQFLERLDAGDLASLGAEARAHAAGCTGCTRALAHAVSLEAALERAFASAPAPVSPEFVDRLMSRIERVPQVRLVPAEVARAAFAAFATPSIAISALGAAALLGGAAAFGFDSARMATAATTAAAPIGRLLELLAHPLPSAGLQREMAVAGLVLGALPALALLLAAAWQLGNAIGEKAPRAL